MAEALSFDKRIDGLVGHYQAIQKLIPDGPDPDPTANPDFFIDRTNAGWISAYLGRAGRRVLHAITFDAQMQYRSDERDFGVMDLRQDTPEQRAERAKILAVMTCPIESGVREARAERIATFLGRVVDGEQIEMTGYAVGDRQREAQSVQFDPKRALFAVLGQIDPTGSYVFLQYDTPESRQLVDDPSSTMLRLPLNAAFRETDPVLVGQAV